MRKRLWWQQIEGGSWKMYEKETEKKNMMQIQDNWSTSLQVIYLAYTTNGL